VQGGTKARTGAYKAVREDAGLKFQRRRRPLSTDQGTTAFLYGEAGPGGGWGNILRSVSLRAGVFPFSRKPNQLH